MARAGLDTASVTAAGAALADELGLAQLTMNVLAERLGVRTPSLYKHVASLADLHRRIAVTAMDELADAVLTAIAGRSGRDALLAGADGMRDYARRHPGRYEAGNAALVVADDDALLAASNRVMATWLAMLHGYHLDAAAEIHALRMLRSVLHGFAVLERSGGFQVDTSTDDSHRWIVEFLDRGLTAPPVRAARRSAKAPT